MQVTVTGRHMGVTEPLKQYCLDKSSKLARFYDRIRLIEVILDGRGGVHTAEMIVHTDRADPFVAKEQHADAYAAVDLLLDKIERQLTRHKERVRNRKHGPPRPVVGTSEEAETDADTSDQEPLEDAQG